jgi:hypothetical protein
VFPGEPALLPSLPEDLDLLPLSTEDDETDDNEAAAEYDDDDDDNDKDWDSSASLALALAGDMMDSRPSLTTGSTVRESMLEEEEGEGGRKGTGGHVLINLARLSSDTTSYPGCAQSSPMNPT